MSATLQLKRPRKACAIIESLESRQLFSLSILDYGALTSAADNSAAIQAALSAAATGTDKQVLVPAGKFKYEHVISIPGGVELMGQADFGGTGTRSELNSTNWADANLKLTGSGAKLRKLYITGVTSHVRDAADATVLVRATGASNFYIERNEIYGGASVGIKVDNGANNGAVNSNKVHDTKADGIHNVHGAHHITISNNTVYATGDDQIAVISYASSSFGICYSINITGNNVTNTGKTNGRGIAVSGGNTIVIDNNTITDSPMAGIYLDSEDSYNTMGLDGITVTRNNIINANRTNTSPHGGILISGRSAFMAKNITIGDATDATKKNTITGSNGPGVIIGDYTDNIKVLRNTIDGSNTSGVRVAQAKNIQVNNNTIKNVTEYGVHFQTGNTGTLTINNNTIDTTVLDGIRVETVPGISINGNTVKNTARHGIVVTGGSSGAVSVNNNVMQNINTSGVTGIRVINISAGSTFSSLQIMGNSYTETLSLDVEWYIYRVGYTGAGVTVSGNTTTTGEPSNPSGI